MALSTLFDDFPIFNYENGGPRRRRRPLLYSVLDSLEDQIGQRVGQVFRLLPSLTLDLEDAYENASPGKKRKLRSGAVSTYEPKSKVVISNKDNKFKVTLDTTNYQPEEITVKVVNDKLAISAKHEAKEKDVYEFYEMYRSFDLPENVDSNAITSHLSASGQLTVEAPLKAISEATERTIPVEIEAKEKEAVDESESSPAQENGTVDESKSSPAQENETIDESKSSPAQENETVDASKSSSDMEKEAVEASKSSPAQENGAE